MQSIKPYICLLLSILLGSASLHAQEANKPNTSVIFNDQEIEYKWGEGKFENVMPFDDPFVIKITNLPPTIDSLSLVFYEIRGNYNLFKNSKSITVDQFKGLPFMRSYFVPWKRQTGSSDTFAHIPVPYHLKPNSKYIIEMRGEERRKPTDEEKESIHIAIKGSQNVQDLIGRYAHDYITNKKLPMFSAFISELNQVISFEVKQVDDHFVFQPPANAADQLKEVATFVKALRNLKGKVDELAEEEDLKNKAVAQAFSKKLEEADFGAFVFQKSTKKSLDNEMSKFDTSGTDAAEKAKIASVNTDYNRIRSSVETILTTLIDQFAVENTYIVNALGSNYPINMTDQADRYLGLDMGEAYIHNFSRIQSYYGLNIYLRPVNKNIPLSRYKSVGDFFLTRSSILLGLTFSSVEKENIRKGILGDKGVLLGAGFRIVSFFRVNGGGVIYYRYPVHPLRDGERYRPKMSPFVSLSFDLDMEALLGAVGKSIFPAKSNTTN